MTEVLEQFGIKNPTKITEIYRTAWNVDDIYVLKASENIKQLDKSVKLTRLLLSEGIPVIEYIDTSDGETWVYADDKYWCLMKRISGEVFDPLNGNLKHNGIVLGKAVAELHITLKNIEDRVEIHESDFYDEFTTWIIPEIEKNGMTFADSVLYSLHTFFEHGHKKLPRQLIHRDIHTSNLLFESDILTGYLDFDMCQKNVRIWDVVYLGCSQLVENYKDPERLEMWREMFTGIIQGYNALQPLSEDEMAAIPVLFLFVEVLFTAFYSKIGEMGLAKNCEEMANWLYENATQVSGAFFKRAMKGAI